MAFNNNYQGSMNIPVPLKNVACQTLLASGTAVHHGSLRRRKLFNKWAEMVGTNQLYTFKWPRSYVVLVGGCIYFYKHETDVKPSRATSLYGFTGVQFCREEVASEIPWPFKLVNALEDRDRTYYFSAASEKELIEWLNVINEQLAFANGLGGARSFPSPNQFNPQTLPLPNQFQYSPNQGPTLKQQTLPRVLPQFPGFGFDDSQQSPTEKSNLPPATSVRPLPTVPIPPESLYVSDESDDDDNGDYDRPQELIEATPNSKTHATGPKIVPIVPCKPARQSSTSPEADTSNKNLTGPVKIPVPIKPKPVPDLPVNKVQPQIAKKPGMPKLDTPLSEEGVIYETMSVEEFSKNDAEEPDVKAAYWKGISEEGENVMKSLTANGIFMIRNSTGNKDNMPATRTLMVRSDNLVRKYKILKSGGKFSLEPTGPFFDTTTLLLQHYKFNCLPHRTTKLTKPYSAVWKA